MVKVPIRQGDWLRESLAVWQYSPFQLWPLRCMTTASGLACELCEDECECKCGCDIVSFRFAEPFFMTARRLLTISSTLLVVQGLLCLRRG